MNILITGATGFIGKTLTNKLLSDKSNRIMILTRNAAKVEKSIIEKVEVLQAEITDFPTLEKILFRLKNVDMVYHLAASLEFFGDKKKLFNVNVTGTINLLNLLKGNIKKFVYISSIEAIGPIQEKDIPANETYLCRPVSNYGESKLEAEKQIKIFSKINNLDFVILRLGNVYGPGSTFFILQISNAILTQGTLLKFLDVYKNRYLQPVYIDDVVAGIILASQKYHPGETYILAGEEYVSIGKLFELVANELNADIQYEKKEIKDMIYLQLRKKILAFLKKADLLTYFISGDSKRIHRAYSIEKAKKELGYCPNTSLKEGISKTIQWLKTEGFLPE